MERKKSIPKLLSFFLFFCIFLSGCNDNPQQPSGSSSQPDILDTGSSRQDASLSGSSQLSSSDVKTENHIPDENAENVILIGLFRHAYDDINKMAAQFNQDQSQYKVELKQYDNYTAFITDILRRQGADIFSLWEMPVEALTQKGILEDLTPYFASSDVVKKEDLVSPIWKAGTIGDKMSCLIPSFTFEGIIVEKGHTQNGGWTVADYFELAGEYPEGMINRDIADPVNLFLNDLMLSPDPYINWEEGTCNFADSDFISFLEELKGYSEKKYNINPSGTLAERLYKREYLTLRTQVLKNRFMSDYLHLKTMLGDEFELAGYPSVGGEPYYRMIYSYAFGMNALSDKKEGAWAFLEYLLSGPVQEKYAESAYPARLDVLNNTLQEVIDRDPKEYTTFGSYNNYTEERENGLPPFTEEDRQYILEMLDYVERPSVMVSGDVAYILLGELKLYFSGDKTAEEVADLIQNRVQLYLDEMQ